MVINFCQKFPNALTHSHTYTHTHSFSSFQKTGNIEIKNSLNTQDKVDTTKFKEFSDEVFFIFFGVPCKRKETSSLWYLCACLCHYVYVCVFR